MAILDYWMTSEDTYKGIYKMLLRHLSHRDSAREDARKDALWAIKTFKERGESQLLLTFNVS